MGTQQEEAHPALAKRLAYGVCPHGAALGRVRLPKAVREAQLSSQLGALAPPSTLSAKAELCASFAAHGRNFHIQKHALWEATGVLTSVLVRRGDWSPPRPRAAPGLHEESQENWPVPCPAASFR